MIDAAAADWPDDAWDRMCENGCLTRAEFLSALMNEFIALVRRLEEVLSAAQINGGRDLEPGSHNSVVHLVAEQNYILNISSTRIAMLYRATPGSFGGGVLGGMFPRLAMRFLVYAFALEAKPYHHKSNNNLKESHIIQHKPSRSFQQKPNQIIPTAIQPVHSNSLQQQSNSLRSGGETQ